MLTNPFYFTLWEYASEDHDITILLYIQILFSKFIMQIANRRGKNHIFLLPRKSALSASSNILYLSLRT